MVKNDTSEEIQKVELTVANQTIIRIVGLVLFTVILLAAVRQASHALILLFTAFFLTLALNAPVNWIGQHLPGRMRGSRSLATTASFLVVVVALVAFLASVVPPLARSTQSFISAAPQLVSNTREQNSGVGEVIRRYKLQDEVSKFSNELSGRLNSISGAAVSGVTTVTSSLISVLTVLVITFMMLIEGPNWVRLAKGLVPSRRRDHITELASDMNRVVRGFVNGQVTLAAIAAIVLLPALLVLDISYPIALIVIIFICGLIPLVGSTIGAVIVSFVALFTSPVAALIILAYYILYQQIENYVIQPRIQANSTNMSPLLVFSSVIIGVNFGGLVGGLVAIPIAGCLRLLVLDILRSRNLLPAHQEKTNPLADTK